MTANTVQDLSDIRDALKQNLGTSRADKLFSVVSRLHEFWRQNARYTPTQDGMVGPEHEWDALEDEMIREDVPEYTIYRADGKAYSVRVDGGYRYASVDTAHKDDTGWHTYPRRPGAGICMDGDDMMSILYESRAISRRDDGVIDEQKLLDYIISSGVLEE